MAASSQPAPPALVFDTSAFFVFFHRKPGYGAALALLARVLRGQAQGLTTFGTLFEVEYVTLAEPAPGSALSPADRAARRLAMIEARLSIAVAPEDRALRSRAARLKALGGVSPVDAYNLALAEALGGTLVHRDAEFAAFGASKAPHIQMLAV